MRTMSFFLIVPVVGWLLNIYLQTTDDEYSQAKRSYTALVYFTRVWPAESLPSLQVNLYLPTDFDYLDLSN